jgi:N-acetylneuraminic acid mutarotase
MAGMREFQYIAGKFEILKLKSGRAAWWVTAVICLVCATVCFGQPAAPSGLTAKAISPQQINLTWKNNSSKELGFQVEQSLDQITFSVITDSSSNVIAYAATNLNPGIKYYFRVCAFNGAGNSAYSNTNSGTTFTPLTQWLLNSFTSTQLTNPAVSGLGANPAGDGLMNLFKYALNPQPLIPDNTNIAWAGTDTILTSNFLTLNFMANATVIDVLFGANVSSNLTTWTSGTNLVTGPISISTNAGMVTEKFRLTMPMTSAPNQFMQLTASYNGVPNSWVTGATMIVTLQETAAGIISNKLYVVGIHDGNQNPPDPNSPTLVYDIFANTWTNVNSPRPFVGDHHGAEVYGGRLYLIGGVDGSSKAPPDGKVQIYDPVTNGWSVGASMPFAAGSCATALINGEIYAAGGIVGDTGVYPNGFTTNATAMYDPVSNIWTMLAPMPVGRNHAAASTDGSKLYVFGGRDGGNNVANGYNTVEIYDPGSNTWVSSTDPGSTLAPLPQARGGMGKAVYYNGDFYVMGGETSNGSGATANKVYNRVDIYNVASNSWRLGTPMPTARHGIFPVLLGNRIYTAGGGVTSGVSSSSIVEIYITP